MLQPRVHCAMDLETSIVNRLYQSAIETAQKTGRSPPQHIRARARICLLVVSLSKYFERCASKTLHGRIYFSHPSPRPLFRQLLSRLGRPVTNCSNVWGFAAVRPLPLCPHWKWRRGQIHSIPQPLPGANAFPCTSLESCCAGTMEAPALRRASHAAAGSFSASRMAAQPKNAAWVKSPRATRKAVTKTHAPRAAPASTAAPATLTPCKKEEYNMSMSQ
jgi:hypothetical protein